MFILAKINKYSGFFTGKYWEFAHGGSLTHRVLYYWHSLGNWALTTLSNMFTNINLTDMETCYKAFRREIIQNLSIEEDRFGFEPDVAHPVPWTQDKTYAAAFS